MHEPDEGPGFRRYLHAAALWFATTQVFGFVILAILERGEFGQASEFVLVFAVSLGVVLLGTTMLWIALGLGDIRRRGTLVAIGGLAGFTLTTLIVIAVDYLLKYQGWLFLIIPVLVPGSLVGGCAAGRLLSQALPRSEEWWPSPKTW